MFLKNILIFLKYFVKNSLKKILNWTQFNLMLLTTFMSFYNFTKVIHHNK